MSLLEIMKSSHSRT